MSHKLSYSEAGKLGWLASKEKNELRCKLIKDKYESNPKKCKYCENIITWKHRKQDYCSKTCARRITSNIQNRICPNCNKKIPYTRKTRHKKWCSHECQLIYTFRYNREHNIPIGHIAVRTYLLLTREYKCSNCKLSKWQDESIPLEAHHKDGNHNNNSEENLELICPNCHSLTDNYKSKNRGNGRPHRRKPVERIELSTSECPD